MKELSIKEKAKAYDEALERARIWQNNLYDTNDKDYADELNYIFPELIEPEDEKIRKSLINVFSTHKDYEMFFGVSVEDIRAWLEKQGTSKKDTTREKVAEYLKNLILDQSQRGFPMLNYEGRIEEEVDFIISIAKKELKQGEQKSTDKVVPKFKVGEWITDGQLTCKVLSVTGKSYELHLYNDDYCHFETDVQSVDKHYHLWTIQDTHDGDVLTSIGFHSNCTFILKGLDNWKFEEPNGDRAVATGYCCLSVSSDKMEFGIQGPDYVEVNTIKPATKIQRDLLFQKMKESGYEWDVEKKELKKIEQNPVYKVESNFKVGDWVVENGVNGNPVQITSFEEDKGIGIKVWFSNGTGTWVDYLKGYHKLTIEDARDGDVLADNLGVILFKSIRDNNVINYYAYLSGIFSVQKDEEYWGYAVNCTLSPATKEQRERFFAAMHDAGFEWDAEKKELKEIKNEIEIPLGAKDSELHEVSYYIPEGYYAEIDDDGVIIKKGKKPSAWSGEDNTYYDDICEILINLIHSETAKVNKDVVQKDLDWLMSIQQRIETK